MSVLDSLFARAHRLVIMPLACMDEQVVLVWYSVTTATLRLRSTGTCARMVHRYASWCIPMQMVMVSLGNYPDGQSPLPDVGKQGAASPYVHNLHHMYT